MSELLFFYDDTEPLKDRISELLTKTVAGSISLKDSAEVLSNISFKESDALPIKEQNLISYARLYWEDQEWGLDITSDFEELLNEYMKKK